MLLGTAAQVASPLKNLAVSLGAFGAKPCLVIETSAVVLSDRLKSDSVTLALKAIAAKVPPVPMFKDEASVPEKVKVLEIVKILPSAIVSVEPVAGAVMVTLLIVVAVAAPREGVVKAGDVCRATTVPLPVVEYDVPQAEPVELAIPAPG